MAQIRDDLRWLVFARDNNRCLGCGSFSGLSVDHIVPQSAGGTDDLSNLQTLCKRCNSAKGGIRATRLTAIPEGEEDQIRQRTIHLLDSVYVAAAWAAKRERYSTSSWISEAIVDRLKRDEAKRKRALARRSA
jgi:hypothetical protein